MEALTGKLFVQNDYRIRDAIVVCIGSHRVLCINGSAIAYYNGDKKCYYLSESIAKKPVLMQRFNDWSKQADFTYIANDYLNNILVIKEENSLK